MVTTSHATGLEKTLLNLLYMWRNPRQGGERGGATQVHLGPDVGTQFFEKTHFEGIQYVKFIPIMNGIPITCTHKEWIIASQLHHPHIHFVYILCNKVSSSN